MISRRTFLEKTMLAAASLPVLTAEPLRFLQTQPGYLPEIGLQLYTVRDLMAKDPETTLQAIAEAGYKQVEGGYIRTYAALLPKVHAAGLETRSCSFPSAFVTGRWDLQSQKAPEQDTVDALIEENALHNMKYLVLSYLHPEERKTLDDYRRLSEKLNIMGEKCNQADIHLCYHHHSFEFKPLKGKVPFELMVDMLEKDKVHFEVDVFWASTGGQDPVALLERLRGRVKLLHLKDKKRGIRTNYDESTVPKKAFQEVGDGVLDIPAILETAEMTSVEQCFVEQDHSADPIASIRQSMKYLRKIAKTS